VRALADTAERGGMPGGDAGISLENFFERAVRGDMPRAALPRNSNRP